MIAKKTNKKTLYSVDRSLGLKFLFAGIFLLVASFAIQQVFIAGTNFKKEYRSRQHKQCLDNGNTQQVCDSKYPLL